MINRLLLILFTLYTFSYSSEETNIDELINKIQQAPIETRYIEMNKLKRILKNQNRQFREETLIKLQKNTSTPPPSHHEQNIDIKPPIMNTPPPPRINDDIHIEHFPKPFNDDDRIKPDKPILPKR